MEKHIFSLLFLCLLTGMVVKAQEKDYNFEEMTHKEIMQITYDEMLEMPFGDLKQMAQAIGVSTDELLNLALNREVSSASKKGESVFESPLSTTVITKEEIQLTGASTYEELFRLVPGMIVRQESNGNYDIHIRGNDNLPPGNFSHFSENMMTLVMVDGRIVYNYINGGTFWESIPVGISDIERIEIIRGASSALYGPNAVSGVINIITRKPSQKGEYLRGNIQAGNYNSYIGSFSFQNRFNEHMGIKVAGGYDFRDRSQDNFYQYATGTYVGADSVTSMFDYKPEVNSYNPELAKNTYNGNVGFYYNPNQDVSMDLNTGWQSSQAQSMFFENMATPFGIRESETGYVDYNASLYDFKLKATYQSGRQNLHKDMVKPIIEYDMDIFNMNLEYDLVLNDLGIGELTVRPGVNYQFAAYRDRPYVKKYDTVGKYDRGLLNYKQELKTMSGSMRIDYKPVSDLRFIAALRADKYNVPDDIYFSWQLVAAYNIDNENIVRGTYSRANRGSFIGNAFANFKNPMPGNYYQYYIGDETLDLLTQDLLEVGYRSVVTDYLQVDFEGFYTKTRNFDGLFPKTFYVTENGFVHDEWHYQNTDLESKQYGFTLNLSIQPIEKMVVKTFGTFQKTELTNVLKSFNSFYKIDYITGNPYDTRSYEELSAQAFEDAENEWTPSFYGGVMVNYTPLQKLNVNASAYFYGEQTYTRYAYDGSHTTISETQDPNFILNAKVAYRITQNTSIFANARNLLDHNQTEIPFNDKIRGLYLIGIDFNF